MSNTNLRQGDLFSSFVNHASLWPMFETLIPLTWQTSSYENALSQNLTVCLTRYDSRIGPPCQACDNIVLMICLTIDMSVIRKTIQKTLPEKNNLSRPPILLKFLVCLPETYERNVALAWKFMLNNKGVRAKILWKHLSLTSKEPGDCARKSTFSAWPFLWLTCLQSGISYTGPANYRESKNF